MSRATNKLVGPPLIEQPFAMLPTTRAYFLETLESTSLEPTGINKIWRKKGFHLVSYMKTYQRARDASTLLSESSVSTQRDLTSAGLYYP